MELSWKYVQMAVLLQRIGAVDIYSDINLLPCMRKTTFTRAQQFPPSCVFQWLEINCGLHSDSSHSAEGLLFIILKISVIWPYRKRSHFTLTQLLVSVSQIYSPPARRNSEVFPSWKNVFLDAIIGYKSLKWDPCSRQFRHRCDEVFFFLFFKRFLCACIWSSCA